MFLIPGRISFFRNLLFVMINTAKHIILPSIQARPAKMKIQWVSCFSLFKKFDAKVTKSKIVAEMVRPH